MVFDFNTLYAIDENRNIMAEFDNFEEAGKYTNSKPFQIVMYNKIAKVCITVPEEELEPFRQKPKYERTR